jgi:very-short-patch-repair endonuclease
MRFRRQHRIGPYIADFACVLLKIVVEVDGGTHCTDAERA